MASAFPRTPENSRHLGRLLEEISWEGGRCTRLRHALRGTENVLTAEAFQALDLLPRQLFFGEILKSATRGADKAVAKLVDEIEECSICAFPGSTFLRPGETQYNRAIAVQPDVLIQSPSIYCFVEAKANCGNPSFQTAQLARQFLLTMRDCADRLPLLLLILPHEPPFPVATRGSKQISESILEDLAETASLMEGLDSTDHVDEKSIAEVVAWTTWHQIAQATGEACRKLPDYPATIGNAIRRNAQMLQDAVAWHGSNETPHELESVKS